MALDKHYDPKQVEGKWYADWMEKGYFKPQADPDKEPYTIVIPPPNVTGILHMGHALNGTLQDILTRWQRLKGRDTLWVPGTDHAGIATQNVVERALKKEGKSRDDLGREKFVERVWEWREQYGNTIGEQTRKLGASCDWSRERFTMDEGLSNAVTEVFIRLYEKDLIYRGNYIINWCPRCQTALSDEENEHEDSDGHLYHIRYPVKGAGKQKYIVVATTRPETLLGDTAVAVNPRDERYKDLKDATVTLPILNRELTVIEDDYVDPEFGTGIVKITPAHDPNDFDMGQRHNLESINVMEDDGSMNEAAGPYAGMDRFDCRKKILEDLEAEGLLEKTEPHRHAVGQCYRCHTIVEPRLSPQWFVKMKPLARPAIEAVKQGRIHFVPDRWSKVYLEWMENIRDWCISRQIWWGHRIPIFYCDDCEHVWAAKGQAKKCASCSNKNIRQDEDVLDTWFSSWLWPFTVFGWPEQSSDLKHFYPTQSLLTASEIIFFWVARMIMAGCEFMGDIPFSEVYIHGTVRDDSGRKMSKSLGNSIDPLDIIEKYSADALRMSLTMLTATGQDVYLSDDKFEVGRNFCTKLWNAARFIQLHEYKVEKGLTKPDFSADNLSADEQYLITHLQQTIRACEDHLQKFRFNDYAKVLYDFVWHKFCDWHVEYAKPLLYGDDAVAKARTQKIMHYAFATSLKLLHPVMPFITEELWHALGYTVEADSIMIAEWPEALDGEMLKASGIKNDAVRYVEGKHDAVRVGRLLRADYNLKPNEALSYILKPSLEESVSWIENDIASITSLLKAGNCKIDAAYQPEGAVPSALSKLGNVYMPIEGLVDKEAEQNRLRGQLDKVADELEKISKKLDNLDFVKKAPTHVIEHQQTRKKDCLERREKLSKLLDAIS